MLIPLPARGVDMLSDEAALPSGYVRRAENVDLGRDGVFTRRDGYEPVTAGAGFHSLYAGSRGVLVGVGSGLYSFDPFTQALTFKADMAVDAPFDACEYNGHTYICGPGALHWIPADSSAARAVGVAPPNPLPSVSAHSAGALTPGDYAVAISRVDSRGEESPTKLLGTYTLTAGLRLDGLPLESGARYRVYLTPADGDVLYQVAEIAATFASYVIGELPEGAPRTTQHLAAMPAGEFIRWHAGRLYVAHGDIIHYSEALRPHLTDPRHNFIQFVGLKFFEPVTGGIYVGDSRGVWFMPGSDPEQFKLQRVAPEVAVRRSSLILSSGHLPEALNIPEQVCAVWLSTVGYVVGTANGQIIALHPERVRLAAGLEGRSRFIVRNGVKQIITLVAASTTTAYGVALDPIIH